MDNITFLRSAATVLSMLIFAGIVVWAYSRKNADRFEEAARLPFGQD